MSFIESFRSELLKSRRTAARYMCVPLAFFIPVILVIEYSIQEDISTKMESNPWLILFRDGFMLFNVVILPLFTLLVTTLTPQVEYRNNAWKQVMASPQTYFNIWMARYAYALMLIALFTLIHGVFLLLTGFVIGFIYPHYNLFSNPIEMQFLLTSTFKSLVCVLGISGAEFWLGMRFRNFVIPIVLAFLMWMVASTTTFDVHMSGATFNPFSYLAFASFARPGSAVAWVMLASVAWCVLFLAGGYIEFVKRREVFR